MIQVQPTHIGLNIALKIIQELQPETPVHITNELLEIINAILNRSIGLGNADLYRLSDRILTLIPFKKKFLERIIKTKVYENMDIYLIYLLNGTNSCYCIPLKKEMSFLSRSLNIIECFKLTP